MAQTGVAMYDFQGDASQGELSFNAGDEITISRQDVGEGWWEGSVNGKHGLFPESYCQIGGGGDDDFSGDDWDDDDDDDWDDEEETPAYQASGRAPAAAAAPPAAQASRAPQRAAYSGGGGGSGSDSFGRAETLKRSVNRFSAFVKAGAEGFMMGTVKDVTLDPNAMLHVVDNSASNSGPTWADNPNPFAVIQVEKAGTRKKYKGVKSYEAYNISGAAQGGSVERRHKHFAWLHERLKDKYSCMCVPPLPDKQYHSKFGENFIDKRQQKLEMWVNRVCRHPVLSRDLLSLRHFLTCPTSDVKGWKLGKRKAEKDDFTGATFFKLISPDVECPRDADQSIEQFGMFLKDMDKNIKKLEETSLSHADRMAGGFRREFKKVAGSFAAVGTCFAGQGGQINGDSVRLSMAIRNLADTIEGVADMWAEQPKKDQIPLHDGLKEYSGLLGQFTDAIGSSKSATAKVLEIEENEGAIPAEKSAVKKRADIIQTLGLCEMAHFHEQRRQDFKTMMLAYTESQIEFHKAIVAKYEAAKKEFEGLGF